MALVEVQYEFPSINSSAQIGDTAYIVISTPQNGFVIGNSNYQELGPIIKISNTTVTIQVDDSLINIDSYLLPLSSISFIFFSKDNAANMTSILGYYGEGEFKNNSASKAELFSTACEVSISSK